MVDFVPAGNRDSSRCLHAKTFSCAVLSTGFLPALHSLVDPVSILLCATTSFVSSLILFYSLKYMEKEKGLERFYSLMLLFTSSMLGVLLASNLLELFLFWEVMGACSYLLISFWHEKPKARRAALRAFLTTKIGDLCLLAAALVFFTETGSFEHSVILGSQLSHGILLVTSTLMIVAAMAKASQLPFYVWLPDAMEGPTPVSALLHSSTMVQAGIYLLARFYPLFEGLVVWRYLGYVSLMSIIVCAVFAMASNNIKRIIAYSTVSQTGYMFLALSASAVGVAAGLYHYVSHALFKSLLFLCAGNVIHACGSKDIWKMGGLYKKMPWTTLAFFLGFIALAAIPPSNGFWSKEAILAHIHDPVLDAFVSMGFILTVVYSTRLFYTVFLRKRRGAKKVGEANWQTLVPVLVLAFSTIAIIGLIPWFSSHIGQAWPSDLFGTPLVMTVSLIMMGFLAWEFYYKYAFKYLRKAIMLFPGTLNKTYSFIVRSAVKALELVADFVENRWYRLNRYTTKFIVGEIRETRPLFEFTRSLGVLTPHRFAGALMLMLCGLLLIILLMTGVFP